MSSSTSRPIKSVHSSSEEETRKLAHMIGARLKPGDWIVLTGQLGAGKTQFVKGLAEALQCVVEPTSPTFSLIQVHRAKGAGHASLRHVDLYRLAAKDVPNLEWEDVSDDEGVTAIEWAEKAKAFWPPRALEVRMSHEGENLRLIEFFGGERAHELAGKVKVTA